MAKTVAPPQIKITPLFSEIWEEGRYSIPAFARRFLEVDVFPHQDKWFSSEVWAIERMFVAGNRSGKSVSAGIKHLHHILYQTRQPRYAAMTNRYVRVNLSLTLDMANIAYQWAVNRALDAPLYKQFVLEDECKSYPFPVFVVGDGKKGRKGFRSELWARSTTHGAKYLLGKDIDGINFDEAAFEPQGRSIIDNVLLMRLADRNGQMDYTSSPNGKNWFYDLFMESQKKPDEMRPPHYYFGMTASSYDNLAIDHDRLRINEQRLGETARLQNIYAVFADVDGVFSTSAIEKCYRDVDYSLPVKPVGTAQYIKAFDFGAKHDPTVGLVARVDTHPAQIVFVGEWGGEGKEAEYVGEGGIYEQVVKVHQAYPGPTYGDSTGPAGKLILEALTKTYNVPMKESDVAGARGKAKENLLMAGRQALEGRQVTFPFTDVTRPLVDQLRYYVLPDENIKTDYVMAFCILAEALRKESYVIETPVPEAAVWGTSAETNGICRCRLTRNLDYCMTHHMPVRANACCGMCEQVLMPVDTGARMIADDFRLQGVLT